MSIRNGLFASELVSVSHPDKLADRLSNSSLEAFFTPQPTARAAGATQPDAGLAWDIASHELLNAYRGHWHQRATAPAQSNADQTAERLPMPLNEPHFALLA